MALCALVIVLAAFAAVRISAMRQGAMRFTAGSDIERWLPALFTVAVPCWFIISAVLYRLPRHLIAGAIALAGALAGPLLALAWRDSLALAAVVSGVVLIADGLIAKSLSCDPA